jgi:hypothetical protein
MVHTVAKTFKAFYIENVEFLLSIIARGSPCKSYFPWNMVEAFNKIKIWKGIYTAKASELNEESKMDVCCWEEVDDGNI